MTDSLVLAIVGHLVGDYLLQTDWMALNKKRRSLPCAIHCFLWTSSVCLFAGWHSLEWLVLFWLHFAQDRTNIIAWWMRLKCKNQSEFMRSDSAEFGWKENSTERIIKITPGLGPWSIIVVDNVWHIVTLWAVWRLLA